MIKLEYTTYYTLSEFIGFLDDPDAYPPVPQAYPTLADDLAYYISEKGVDYAETLAFMSVDENLEITMNDDARSLLNALEARYREHIAVITRDYVDYGEPSEEEKQASFASACESFYMNLVSVLALSYPRYSTILGIYATQKAKLLEEVKLKSSSLARRNDAPQNSGDYSGDDYASEYNYVEGETDIDHGTPIQRLHEIEISYNNVIADWLKDFAGLFTLKENLS